MSRAAQKERRRAALLEGAIAVLSEHGLEGFTTGRIAAQAGIAQSGFYKYWPDREAALRDVAEHIGEQVLQAIRDARLAAGGDLGQLRAAFAGGMGAMLERREVIRLFLRFRREPGPLGDVFRDLVERGLEELHTDMVAMGYVPADHPDGTRLAFYALAISVGAVEALLDGRFDDVSTVADDLGLVAANVLGGLR